MATSNEIKERSAIFDAVNSAVLRRDYKSLDHQVQNYRVERSRTASGTWKLPYFYLGFGSALTVQVVDGICVNPLADFAKEWASFSPNEPAPYILEAASYTTYGVCIRGDGLASETPMHALVAAAENAQKTIKLLTENHAVASADPHFYEVMIDAYMYAGRSKSDFKELLNEATAKEPYYYNTYFAALHYLLPAWHGDNRDLDWLGRYAVEHTREEDGTGAYARLFWILDSLNEIHSRSLMDWATVKRGMVDVLKNHNDEWNVVNFALMACRQNDGNTFSEFMKKVPPSRLQYWRHNTEWRKCFHQFE